MFCQKLVSRVSCSGAKRRADADIYRCWWVNDFYNRQFMRTPGAQREKSCLCSPRGPSAGRQPSGRGPCVPGSTTRSLSEQLQQAQRITLCPETSGPTPAHRFPSSVHQQEKIIALSCSRGGGSSPWLFTLFVPNQICSGKWPCSTLPWALFRMDMDLEPRWDRQ